MQKNQIESNENYRNTNLNQIGKKIRITTVKVRFASIKHIISSLTLIVQKCGRKPKNDRI